MHWHWWLLEVPIIVIAAAVYYPIQFAFGKEINDTMSCSSVAFRTWKKKKMPRSFGWLAKTLFALHNIVKKATWLCNKLQ